MYFYFNGTYIDVYKGNENNFDNLKEISPGYYFVGWSFYCILFSLFKNFKNRKQNKEKYIAAQKANAVLLYNITILRIIRKIFYN